MKLLFTKTHLQNKKNLFYVSCIFKLTRIFLNFLKMSEKFQYNIFIKHFLWSEPGWCSWYRDQGTGSTGRLSYPRCVNRHCLHQIIHTGSGTRLASSSVGTGGTS